MPEKERPDLGPRIQLAEGRALKVNKVNFYFGPHRLYRVSCELRVCDSLMI
jgi:hypothetical protein